jgi:hypothetical protein
MHRNIRVQSRVLRVGWKSANVTITILLTLLFLLFLFCFLSVVAQTARAQSPVPPTARQAATIPQYAARLARRTAQGIPDNASRVSHPIQPRASSKNPADPRARNHPAWPLDDNILYENGPINEYSP